MSAYPEFDQVEGVLWALIKQLLQTSLLLGELVVDLPDVHTLQQRIAVAQAALADVHKKVLVVLRREKRLNQTDARNVEKHTLTTPKVTSRILL